MVNVYLCLSTVTERPARTIVNNSLRPWRSWTQIRLSRVRCLLDSYNVTIFMLLFCSFQRAVLKCVIVLHRYNFVFTVYVITILPTVTTYGTH